ncbi:uncharacterized protein [Venturia canescens]|uniref:uncharacterized protein n=1 Tax=Venturia canescens TaxID=32260 RepID=UPI001C9C2D35|nr:uncharacterized protein LOC122407744 [Venturia canescens]
MTRLARSSGSRMLRRIITNLTTTASIVVVTAGAASISPTDPSIEERSSQDPLIPSPSPPTMLALAITDSVTIPANPSMALTSPVVTTTAKPDQHVYNSTGCLVEQDEIEYSIVEAFCDMQTVFLACIATLLPLIVALAIGFGVRHAWRKYRNRRNSSSGLPWYRGVCSRDDTAESLRHRPHSRSDSIQPTRILSVQDLVNGLDGPRYICETEVMDEVALVGAATSNVAEYASPGNHTSKNANGNIITLTLKNNHIIVETEERAVTMESNNKYQDNNCSFVVEAQTEYRNTTGRVTDQQALVHREEIPEDHCSDFDKTKFFGSTNTGLSQSDLSISSQGSINHSYRYGNQVEYEVAGQFGYSTYVNGLGDYESDTTSRRLEGGSKWVEIEYSPDTEKTLLNESKASSIEKWVEADYSSDNDKAMLNDTKNLSLDKQDVNEQTSLIDKRNNVDLSQDSGSSLEHQDSTDASNSTDTVRSNPNLQMNGTTANKLESMECKSLTNELMEKSLESNKPVITGVLLKEETLEDTLQEQQRKLGNGTLTPEHKMNEDTPTINQDIKTIKKQKSEGTSTFVPTHKRSGSIPPRLIEESLEIDRKKSLDIYSQIKTSTKSILPGLSPKFELLQNEVSPIEEKES